METKSRKKLGLRKEDIGTPTNFVHIQHVGFKPIKTRDLEEVAQTSQSETDNQYEESDDFSSDEDKHPLVCTCPPEYSPYHRKDHNSSSRMAMVGTPTIPEHRDNPLDDLQQYSRSPPLRPLPPKPNSGSTLSLNLLPNMFKSSKSSNQQKNQLPPSKIPRSSSISRTSSITSNNSYPTPPPHFSAPEDELPLPPTPNVQRRVKSPGSLFRRRSFSIHGGSLNELPPIKTSSTYRSSMCLPTVSPGNPGNQQNLATLGKSNTFVRQRRPLPAIPPPTAPVATENSQRKESRESQSDSGANNSRFSLSRGLSFTLTRRSNRNQQRPLPPTPPTTPNPKTSSNSSQFTIAQSSQTKQGNTLPKLQIPLVPVSKVSPLTPTVWPLAPIPFVPLPQINDHGSTTGFVSFDTFGRQMSADYDELPDPPPVPVEVINLNCYRHSPSGESLPEPPPDPMEFQTHFLEESLPEPPPAPGQEFSENIYSTIKRKDVSGSRVSLCPEQRGRTECGNENFQVQEAQLDKITKILGDKVFYSQWPSIMDQLLSQTNFRYFGESSSPSKHYADIVRKTLELWLVMNPENSTFEALLKAVEDGRHKLAADTLKDSRTKILNK